KSVRGATIRDTTIPAQNGIMNAIYGIKGSPSLRRITYAGIGVIHHRNSPSQTDFPLRGAVWVNELRLVDVDNAKGFAYRFDAQVKLADLGGVGFNYNKRNPTFHGLDQRFGDQTDHTDWSMNAGIDAAKFFPTEWQGTAIGMSYSHGES